MLLGAILALAAPGLSQEIILSNGWNPRVGSGALYQSVTGSLNLEIELSTTASETVNGTTGYWIEQNHLDTDRVEKTLMVLKEGNHMQALRTITQRRGEDPVESPTQAPAPNLWEIAKRVGSGTEEITTPAGTFKCERYHANNGKWDAWFSSEVSPFGLVRIVNDEGTEMVVVSMITAAKDHITGTPKKAAPATR